MISLYTISLAHFSEINEESHPYFEYIQIFKRIPSLFEYLIEALEERPEILEKNDVTIFKRNLEVNTDENGSSDNEKKTEKRDTDSNDDKIQDELGSTHNVAKRDAGDSKGTSKTTIAYEYGNSNIVMKAFDESELESNKLISNRIANYDDRNTLVDSKNYKREIMKRQNSINSPGKRNVEYKLNDDVISDMLRKNGDVFFGFESFFGLDLKPEEIEERILSAEKLLEEHNTKKDKED